MAGGRDTRYLAIVERIAAEIESGALAAGQRLPTHRDFARELGVSVQTVTRAYAEAARKGLVSGQVGRGTFVIGMPSGLSSGMASGLSSGLSSARAPRRVGEVSAVGWTSFGDGPAIDLAFNCPVLGDVHACAVRAVLAALEGSRDLGSLLAYQPPWLGLARHREAGSAWLRARGLEAKPADIVVTSGAQHAAATALAALTEPGDTVLTEALTDPGIKFIAASRRLNLKGVAIDGNGLIPEALDEACRSGTPAALFCLPTHHSPTAAVMPAARRKAVAAVAREHGLPVIENDIYGPYVADHPPPLASFAPELVHHVTSLSKSVVPALRIGYLAAPPGTTQRLVASLGAASWMASPLTAELAAGLIESGTAETLVAWQRAEMAGRQALAAKILAGTERRAQPTGPSLWLALPEPWTASQFSSHARARGVLVTPADAFAVARDHAPHAVRLSLGGAVAHAGDLAKALEILAAILTAQPQPGYLVL